MEGNLVSEPVCSTQEAGMTENIYTLSADVLHALDTFSPEKKEGYPFSLQSALRIMQTRAPMAIPAMQDQWTLPVAQ